MIDTHCHLTDKRLLRNLSGTLQRARGAGVETIVCASSSLDDSGAVLELAARHEGIFGMAGVHPHEAKDAPLELRQPLEDLLARDKCVAMGEIGLDYHYDFSPREVQQRIFAQQLQIAKDSGMAVIIHTREAFDDTMSVIAESGIDGGSLVFHSFTGDASGAARALAINAAISFSGIVTFKNAAALREAAVTVPADRLLVETDSPYLSPEPVRKMKVNEPANVVHVARRLAAIRNERYEVFAEAVTDNARRILGLPLD